MMRLVKASTVYSCALVLRTAITPPVWRGALSSFCLLCGTSNWGGLSPRFTKGRCSPHNPFGMGIKTIYQTGSNSRVGDRCSPPGPGTSGADRPIACKKPDRGGGWVRPMHAERATMAMAGMATVNRGAHPPDATSGWCSALARHARLACEDHEATEANPPPARREKTRPLVH